MMFGQLASSAMLLAKFHAGTKESLSDSWLPLLEQSTKFVLNVYFITLPEDDTRLISKFFRSL